MRGDGTLAHLIAPIDDLLHHPKVTDVCFNKPYQVWFRVGGAWERRAVPSFSFDAMDAMSILIGQRTGREFDEANPYVNSTLPGGQRFQGVRPPGTHDSRILWAIRRPPAVARKLDDPDFDELTSEVNTMAQRRASGASAVAECFKQRDWRGLFRAARLAGQSIGFCGAMGDGKSDMVRRCIQVFRPHTRMGTLQTDDEMGDTGPENLAPVLYDDTKVPADEAVRIAKRLAVSEIVMQEVRGPEAWSLLMAMNSGCSGLTTWHANEGEEQEALRDMARGHPSAAGMPEDQLMNKVRSAFDVIAYCRRNDEGQFRISSVRLMAQEREAS
jgi:type IV secretory pathway ATPase VirB11/archaellum biosynthesis ATPase